MRIEPQKGKPLDKLPIKEAASFNNTKFLVSTKYDGNQIWITKRDNQVRYFTSDWKEFDIPHLTQALLLNNRDDFILVGEFMYGCEGKLGDRRKSAILTTWRTNFAKGVVSSYDQAKVNIKVFDCIVFDHNGLMETNFKAKDRLIIARLLNLPAGISVVNTSEMTGAEAILKAKRLVHQGWEGVMCIGPDTIYQIGKRVNYAVKIKFRKTADLLCIDVEEGQGKCNGIGALVLQDSQGRIVRVGSGLDYSGSTRDGKFIGKVVEIEYEQIMDTYIQPTFIAIRHDKCAKDID